MPIRIGDIVTVGGRQCRVIDGPRELWMGDIWNGKRKRTCMRVRWTHPQGYSQTAWIKRTRLTKVKKEQEQ